MCLNCHVVSVSVEFKNLEAIKAACKRKGWNFVEGQTTYRWVGRWHDDSPVPRNLFESEEEYLRVCAMTPSERKEHMPTILGKCTHAIQLPGAAGEIGLLQRGGQFIPIWDYYTRGLSKVRSENGMAGFVQAYAVEQAKVAAMIQGNFCTEEQEQDGTIKLHIKIPEL